MERNYKLREAFEGPLSQSTVLHFIHGEFVYLALFIKEVKVEDFLDFLLLVAMPLLVGSIKAKLFHVNLIF